MDTTKLIAIVSILITLGMASERLVEIFKGFIPTPNETSTDEKLEAKRKAKISMLAIACGIFTAFLASPVLAGIFAELFKGTTCKTWVGLTKIGTESPCGIFDPSPFGIFVIIALGLLASVGSAFWNSILEYLIKLKDLKKAEVANMKAVEKTEQARARQLDVKTESIRANISQPETGQGNK